MDTPDDDPPISTDGLLTDGWRERVRARQVDPPQAAPPDVPALLEQYRLTVGVVDPGTVIVVTMPHAELTRHEQAIRDLQRQIGAAAGHDQFMLMIGEPDMDVTITPCDYAAATFAGLTDADRADQIDELGKYIAASVPGEPSQSQGAVDTAIRVLQTFLTTFTVEDAEQLELAAKYTGHHAGALLNIATRIRTLIGAPHA